MDGCANQSKANQSVDKYFIGFATFYFSEGIKKLEEPCTKCVEVEGDYNEQLKKNLHRKRIFI